MNIRSLTLSAAAVLAVGVFAATGPAGATGGNHPECATGLIKEVAHNQGTSYTVPTEYAGATVWLKIGPHHYDYSHATGGETITPDTLSGWPRSNGGNPKDISHVDICPGDDPTPTTQPPETTVPPTTVPETTPPTTAPETSIPETTQPSTTPPTSVPETTTQPPVSEPEPTTPPTSDPDEARDRKERERERSEDDDPVTDRRPDTTVPEATSTTIHPDVCYLADGTVLNEGDYIVLDEWDDTTWGTHVGPLPCGPIPPPVTLPSACGFPDGTAITEFVILDDWIDGAGTTGREFLPCGPVPEASAAVDELPATGGRVWLTVAGLGGLMVLTGTVLRRLVNR